MYASRHCCTVLGQLNKHCRTCLLERLFVRPVSLMQALEGCTLRVILGKTRCGAFKPASAAKIWSTSMSREAVLVVPAHQDGRPGNVLRVSRHLHHTRYGLLRFAIRAARFASTPSGSTATYRLEYPGSALSSPTVSLSVRSKGEYCDFGNRSRGFQAPNDALSRTPCRTVMCTSPQLAKFCT